MRKARIRGKDSLALLLEMTYLSLEHLEDRVSSFFSGAPSGSNPSNGMIDMIDNDKHVIDFSSICNGSIKNVMLDAATLLAQKEDI